MSNGRFCIACASRLQRTNIEGRERAVCTECGWVQYEQLIVGAGALIELDGRLLLQCRTTEPFKGEWNLPAGHVESDEDPARAVVREVREETGLVVSVDSLFDAFFFDDHPKGCGVFLVYRCTILGGTLQEGEPGLNPTYFGLENLPPNICGGGHSKAISAWRMRKRLTREEKWGQLSNAISLRSSEDQVLWSIFGTFWAANAILLVALFTTGKLPNDPDVGLVIALVGVIISLAWDKIQRRALGHVKRHEALMYKLEDKLEVDPAFALSTQINKHDYQKFVGLGIRARHVMLACSMAAGTLWLCAFIYFLRRRMLG